MNMESLFARHYYGLPGFVDGTTEFHQLLRRFIRMDDQILEIGSGPSNQTSHFLSRQGRVTGVDISDEVLSNRWLAEAKVYDGNQLPLANSSFQACVSDYLIEHLSDPEGHLHEIDRVLRPGGVYCFRTPNLWHYVTLVSRVLPHWAHLRLANRLRGLGKEAHDPYLTVYAANTRFRIRKLARTVGLSPLLLSTIEKEPSYGRASAAVFFPMMFYERVVNSSPVFAGLRVNILGVLQKPGSLRRN